MHLYIYIHIYIYIYIYMCVCVYLYIYVYMRMFLMYDYSIYIYIYIYIHDVYTYIHDIYMIYIHMRILRNIIFRSARDICIRTHIYVWEFIFMRNFGSVGSVVVCVFASLRTTIHTWTWHIMYIILHNSHVYQRWIFGVLFVCTSWVQPYRHWHETSPEIVL